MSRDAAGGGGEWLDRSYVQGGYDKTVVANSGKTSPQSVQVDTCFPPDYLTVNWLSRPSGLSDVCAACPASSGQQPGAPAVEATRAFHRSLFSERAVDIWHPQRLGKKTWMGGNGAGAWACAKKVAFYQPEPEPKRRCADCREAHLASAFPFVSSQPASEPRHLLSKKRRATGACLHAAVDYHIGATYPRP